jgi:hypothetical protein
LYEIANSLGVSERQLLVISRTAIEAAFSTPDRRAELMRDLGAADRSSRSDG